MMQWDRLTLGRMAKELGFPRDTLEKVCRLADVLRFMESDELLSEGIALKGGTAINLTIFDLPRLSVDIDLDYCRSIEREKMLVDRGIITEKISKYMMANGYVLSPKSKSYHALDSFVYEYINCGGTKDNLKIEINYMLRCHVLPVARREVRLHLDASIDKLDNLAMNVQIDKEKRVENTKSEKQNVPDRAEAEPERVNAEIVYTPMVAEAHEYQYNADAFEARGGADVKVGTAEKVSKVREDKAR